MKRTPLRRKTGDTPAKRAHKKVRKMSVSTAKKKAWVAFSKWIRAREPRCFTCGFSGPGLQAGHYIPKSIANALYFSEIAVQTQCMRCNLWLLGNSVEFAPRLQEKYGHGILEELRTQSRERKQWTIKELEEIQARYAPETYPQPPLQGSTPV